MLNLRLSSVRTDWHSYFAFSCLFEASICFHQQLSQGDSSRRSTWGANRQYFHNMSEKGHCCIILWNNNPAICPSLGARYWLHLTISSTHRLYFTTRFQLLLIFFFFTAPFRASILLGVSPRLFFFSPALLPHLPKFRHTVFTITADSIHS